MTTTAQSRVPEHARLQQLAPREPRCGRSDCDAPATLQYVVSIGTESDRDWIALSCDQPDHSPRPMVEALGFTIELVEPVSTGR